MSTQDINQSVLPTPSLVLKSNYIYETKNEEHTSKAVKEIFQSLPEKVTPNRKHLIRDIRASEEMAAAAFNIVKPFGDMIGHKELSNAQNEVVRAFSLLNFIASLSDLWKHTHAAVHAHALGAKSHYFSLLGEMLTSSLLALSALINSTISLASLLPFPIPSLSLSGSLSFDSAIILLSYLTAKTAVAAARQERTLHELKKCDDLSTQSLEQVFEKFAEQQDVLKMRDNHQVDWARARRLDVDFLQEARSKELSQSYGAKALEKMRSGQREWDSLQEIGRIAELRAAGKIRQAKESLSSDIAHKYIVITGLVVLIAGILLIHFFPPLTLLAYLLLGGASALLFSQNVYEWIGNKQALAEEREHKAGRELAELSSPKSFFEQELEKQIAELVTYISPQHTRNLDEQWDFLRESLIDTQSLNRLRHRLQSGWSKNLQQQLHKLQNNTAAENEALQEISQAIHKVSHLTKEQLEDALLRQGLKLQNIWEEQQKSA